MNIYGANLTGACLEDANLCGANLYGIEITEEQLYQLDII
ncbi:pentapeptide repeat-containing protein [Spiroplasma kunkelii]|nr:pentapeptide repeat-containing protein [Spiroplasma kunkelii]